jgi:hypothetical protein
VNVAAYFMLTAMVNIVQIFVKKRLRKNKISSITGIEGKKLIVNLYCNFTVMPCLMYETQVYRRNMYLIKIPILWY